jgi:hypothetical protein
MTYIIPGIDKTLAKANLTTKDPPTAKPIIGIRYKKRIRRADLNFILN